MRIKGDYMLDVVGGERMAIPLFADREEQTGLVKLNEVGAFLWERLQDGAQEQELVAALLKEYAVEKEKAAQDVSKFVEKLRMRNLLEE